MADYFTIPEMKCRPGCGDCCGPVPWTPQRLAAVEARIPPGTQRFPIGRGVIVLARPDSMKCPFWSPVIGCGVYQDRPTVCRLFGAVDHPQMICPHKCGPIVKLTEAESRRELLREEQDGGP